MEELDQKSYEYKDRSMPVRLNQTGMGLELGKTSRIIPDLWEKLFSRSAMDERPLGSSSTQLAHGFMMLPLELRSKIYQYAMGDLPDTIDVKRHLLEKKNGRRMQSALSTSLLSNQHLPMFFYTSRTILYECLLTYLRTTQIWIEYAAYAVEEKLHAVLGRFPANEGYAALRKIAYEDSRTLTFNLRKGLIEKCPGLSRLSLRISYVTVATVRVRSADSKFGIMIEPVEYLRETHGLRVVFKLKALKKLELRCNGAEHITRYIGCTPEQLFDNLVLVLKEGFDAHGRKVEITTIYESI
jgi:hypothetical protein